jgi:AcrR family transcriptional regulator
MSKNGTLSPKQTATIAALLDSRGVAEAAQKAGVPVRTVYRWLQTDDAFKAALRDAEGEMLDSAMRRLLQLQDVALTALHMVLAARDTPPSARVAAAGRVLDATIRMHELRSIEDRLAALEAAQEGGL